ncbi:reduced folate transporter [Neolamprologus brichardi]|uniref:reduced folate transporter n=1 Tax=Neolamprologus brichardi TaxID=32507 RepID=UPI0016437F6A|nr:reduced folate transporter [Neolamprologus brichardi]
MAVLVPAFLLTDLLRYKPVLIIQGVSQVIIWIILLLGGTLLQMQFMEFFYGITMACRVAYSSYIFSLVNPVFYQRVAGYSRSSVLLGVFTSSILGQLCMSLGNITFYTLNSISLGFVSFGLLLSLCLPWPKRSLFFNRTNQEEKELVEVATKSELDKMDPKDGGPSFAAPPCPASTWKDSVFMQMLLEVRNVLKRPNLRLWSLWWVFNSTGYYLVLFYVHILWNKVYPATENKNVYNGGVEAASTLLSETFPDIFKKYFRSFYQFLVPIATFQIASSLTKELCALVFGINTFFGTVLKTIISLIFTDKRGLALDVHSQFLVYFFYFTLLTVVYFACAAVVICRHYRNERRGGVTRDQPTPTELSPVVTNKELEPLSNGKRA